MWDVPKRDAWRDYKDFFHGFHSFRQLRKFHLKFEFIFKVSSTLIEIVSNLPLTDGCAAGCVFDRAFLEELV